MARTLELWRHTDDDGDRLSEQGVADAVRIGRELTGPYAVAVSSGAQRATQTIGCMLAGLGEPVPGGVLVDDGFRSDREDEWRQAYRDGGSGHLDDFRRVAPALVRDDGRVLADALQRVLHRLDDGQRALVVGHSPTSEAAVLALTGTTIGPLGKGSGVVIEHDGQAWSVTGAP